MQVSIEASSAKGVTTKQLDAATVPHFSSLDASQYRGLKCERGDEKAAGRGDGSALFKLRCRSVWEAESDDSCRHSALGAYSERQVQVIR